MSVGRGAALAFAVTAIAAFSPSLCRGQSFVSSSAPFGTVNVGLPQMAMGRLEALIHGGNYVRLKRYPETHQGRRLSRAVGRLEILRADGRIGYCTASIISRDYVLTNHHCLPGKDEPSRPVRALLLMNYYDETRWSDAVPYDVDVRPVETSPWPDYSILRVAGNPSARFGALTMPIAAPLPSEPLIMFHHPRAQPMVLSAKGCGAADRPIDGNSQLIHYCDTDEGSSGAPILDVNGTRLIGLHYSGTPGFNLAIPMTRLRQSSAILAQLFPDQSPPPVRRTEETPPPQGPRVFRDCAECPEMVVVPAGSFTMGSTDAETTREKVPDEYARWERPRQRITITRPFALGKTHVTRREFAAFVAATGYDPGPGCWTWVAGKWEVDKSATWRNPGFSQTEEHPVVCVSFTDAERYVGWLNTRVGGVAAGPYSLPSEAQWEYAARAGTDTARFWGDGRDSACVYANVSDAVAAEVNGYSKAPEYTFQCQDGFGNTAPAGRFRPNGFGLHDMLGNALQWTADCFRESLSGQPADGGVWTGNNCTTRVLRGGSWNIIPYALRSASRGRGTAGSRSNLVGFRVARTVTR